MSEPKSLFIQATDIIGERDARIAALEAEVAQNEAALLRLDSLLNEAEAALAFEREKARIQQGMCDRREEEFRAERESAQRAQERMRLELVRMDDLYRQERDKSERLGEVVEGELAYRHTVEAQVVELSAQANQLELEAGAAQNALRQIDRETRSASDVMVLRLGSIARAALALKVK
jgi:chromosome segregation ATPase